MAKIIGIDIQNRYVRATLLVTTYRKISIEALSEIDRSEAPSVEEAVQACLLPIIHQSDSVAVAVDGDVAFIHRLTLPPTALKQLSEVIPFELEAQVPVDIDDLVYDFVQLPRETSESPVSVLAAAVRTEHVKQRLDVVSRAISREPERVGVGALPLANLANVTPELFTDHPLALLELGEDRSEIVVLVRGQPAYARTLSIGVSGLPGSAPQLAAQLRQTMASASLAVNRAIEGIYLTGGGAAASGAIDYLAAEVKLPVTLLPPPRLDGLTEDQTAALPRFSRALGLALGLRGRPKDLDLRRGGLSYQRGFAFIKEKAPLLSSLGAVILLSFFFSTWADLRSLAHEHEKLSTDLAALSKDALHEETTDPDRARELLENATAHAEIDPMPHIDGFDVMVELSKAVPQAITHDVDELEFSREHLKLRGIVGSAQEAQQIADDLKQNKCFSDVKITKVSQVVNGTRQKYMLESDLRCPEDVVATKKGEGEEQEMNLPSFDVNVLRERFDRLEPREQKLLGGLVLLFGFMMVIAIPIALFATSASRSRENAAIREVAQAIMDARPQLELRDIQRQKVLARYGRATPPLAGLLEQLATLHSIEIPESQDRPIVPHGGKRYEERSTKIELQKVGMKNLALFLEGIVTSGFPVRVSGIDIRKRATEPDSWDVSLIVSAYDRKEPEKTKPASSAEATETEK